MLLHLDVVFTADCDLRSCDAEHFFGPGARETDRKHLVDGDLLVIGFGLAPPGGPKRTSTHFTCLPTARATTAWPASWNTSARSSASMSKWESSSSKRPTAL